MIYKAPSIYNLGGGGGGYSDGGELVKADYIIVPNNSISEYNNDETVINFVIDNGGNPNNSIIELTTTVNATINVYEYKDGFYYLIGVVGSNMVTAGNEYNLSVIGNSFILENVTPAQATPEAINFDGVIYPLVDINGVLWSAKDLKIAAAEYKIRNDNYYYRTTSASALNVYISSVNGRCRLPTYSEIGNLIDYFGGGTSASTALCSSDGWGSGGNGNNSSGLNFENRKKFYDDGTYAEYNQPSCYSLGQNGFLQLFGANNNAGRGSNMGTGEYYSSRFVVEL